MPLSSELQYNMSEHVNSPASLLGNYCVYLKIYPGGKSCGRGPRKGVSAYLVFAPIYDSGQLPWKIGIFYCSASGLTEGEQIQDLKCSS